MGRGRERESVCPLILHHRTCTVFIIIHHVMDNVMVIYQSPSDYHNSSCYRLFLFLAAPSSSSSSVAFFLVRASTRAAVALFITSRPTNSSSLPLSSSAVCDGMAWLTLDWSELTEEGGLLPGLGQLNLHISRETTFHCVPELRADERVGGDDMRCRARGMLTSSSSISLRRVSRSREASSSVRLTSLCSLVASCCRTCSSLPSATRGFST